MPTTATVDGAQVNFEVHGDGPPLLFVHGLGDDLHVWTDVVSLLKRDFTCVTMDLRGHGMTHRAHDFDPFGLVRDVESVVLASRLVDPVLIGHSLGGFAVTVYAAQHAARGVINVDQSLALTNLATAVRTHAPELAAGRVADVLWTVASSLGTGTLSRGQISELRKSRYRITSEVVLGLWRPLLEDSATVLTSKVDRAIRGIEAPYLALHGNPVSTDYAAWLRTLIPQVVLEAWPGVGHFPQLTQPHALATRIAKFARC